MTVMRRFTGLSVVGMVLAVAASAQAPDVAKSDPANVAGERVRAAVTVREIAANEGATALWQSLVKLRTRASLMMIVAHPDDEDGGMLTYEARGQGAHVARVTRAR